MRGIVFFCCCWLLCDFISLFLLLFFYCSRWFGKVRFHAIDKSRVIMFKYVVYISLLMSKSSSYVLAHEEILRFIFLTDVFSLTDWVCVCVCAYVMRLLFWFLSDTCIFAHEVDFAIVKDSIRRWIRQRRQQLLRALKCVDFNEELYEMK